MRRKLIGSEWKIPQVLLRTQLVFIGYCVFWRGDSIAASVGWYCHGLLPCFFKGIFCPVGARPLQLGISVLLQTTPSNHGHLSLKCHCQCCDTRCWSPKACRVEWEELWSYTRIQDSGVHRKDGSHAVRDSNGSQNRRWEASGNVNLSGLQTEEQPPSSAVSQR